MAATQGVDRIPDALGYLVLNEEGAVLNSGGHLENDEVTANKITKLVHTAYKIPVTSDKKDVLRRISVILDDVVFMVTVSQHKIFVCKKHYNPQEAVTA
ncbi:ragulator complex protein LAMTOR4-like [Physella acuta]|uniref:ragulator complex protein LAMTOR4-like n=1 Tax=Physella acuta TaxID=109671 RepID=UPI0027DC76CD|nr:ragulator complex protein LAMTOR4-like [Physella acuta]